MASCDARLPGSPGARYVRGWLEACCGWCWSTPGSGASSSCRRAPARRMCRPPEPTKTHQSTQRHTQKNNDTQARAGAALGRRVALSLLGVPVDTDDAAAVIRDGDVLRAEAPEAPRKNRRAKEPSEDRAEHKSNVWRSTIKKKARRRGASRRSPRAVGARLRLLRSRPWRPWCRPSSSRDRRGVSLRMQRRWRPWPLRTGARPTAEARARLARTSTFVRAEAARSEGERSGGLQPP